MNENLMSGLLKERDRVKELKTEYDKIPTGKFGSIMLSQILSRTDAAISAGDVIEMMVCYEELKECN